MTGKYLTSIPLSLLAMALILNSCSQSKTEPSHPVSGKVEVEAMVIQKETLANTIETTGSIMANEEVQLKSEVAGRVEKINFKEGEAVRKGQLLVQVDNAQYYAQLKQVSVQLQQARKTEKRQKELLSVEGISEETYEQSQLKVAQLDAQKAELEAELEHTIINAPFDGTIGLRMISPGEYISPGDNIAYLVQQNPIKVSFSIPEMYAGQLKVNNIIHFKVAGIKDTLSAKVYAIEPRIDPNSRSIPVRAKAGNKNGQMVPGAFSQITVNLDSFTDAILIPSSAVITENTGKSVFTIKKGKAVKKAISTGIRTDKNLQVLDGLQVGDTLITTGLLGLKEGAAVTVSKLNNPTVTP